jgi:hypothetical protein
MDAYYERLTTYAVPRSRVIGIEFTAPTPALAAEVANAVADSFVDLQEEAKRQSAVAATTWLEQEIDRLRARVQQAEEAVAAYRAGNDLFDIERTGGEGASLSAQQLGDLNAELARARAARAEAEARADLVEQLLAEGGQLESSEEVLNSQLIQRLRERQAALLGQVAELSTTLLPGHPSLRALEGQIVNLESQIRAEAEKVLASLRTAARVAAARETSLVQSLEAAKADVSRTNEQEIALRALEREATAQRELLESFLLRHREAAARADAVYLPADARIISRAVPPIDPSFPKRVMLAVAAALAVLLLATAALMIGEFTSGRAYRLIRYGVATGPSRPPEALPPAPPPTPRTIEHAEASPPPPRAPHQQTIAMPAPPAATGHGAPAAESELAPRRPHAPEEESAGTAELAELLGNDAVRVALFSGAAGGEGAGDLAYDTARIVARAGLRCVLVDLGRVASRALGNERPGLGDILTGDATFGEAIRREDESQLHVIPLGALGPFPPLQRLHLVIGALTHSFDRVIVVADRLEDWPHEHVHPDIAAIVCGPDATDGERMAWYDATLERGARSAVIVRYTAPPEDQEGGRTESEAA